MDKLESELAELTATVKQLKKLVKRLIKASNHEHDWNRTGDHSDENVERKCNICDLHEQYVYPMIPYENRWENVKTGKTHRE